ncbi:MAG: hypothetical protein COT74_09275 [Bdellovibrionales bacterium CG10_big_fil_rev_8_21_14_0_10_45_34]|nr:MAG: hypothetical protein COT74_09275 [Bdellovibrionales bacterium CG10_big_fil_rev_8_21_14_0_10_45_34]
MSITPFLSLSTFGPNLSLSMRTAKSELENCVKVSIGYRRIALSLLGLLARRIKAKHTATSICQVPINEMTRLLWRSAAASLALFTSAISLDVSAQRLPKTKVDVVVARDRHITFMDGKREFFGQDVSYLIAQEAFKSGRFVVRMLDQSTLHGLAKPMSTVQLSSSPSLVTMLQTRHSRTDWNHFLSELQFREVSSAIKPSSFDGHISDKVTQALSANRLTWTPEIKELQYISGERSNRVVYGFTQQTENPYNDGVDFVTDNEFVQPNNEAQTSCRVPNFFGESMKTSGWGPFRSNFGANSDEGLSFSILGFGFQFKKKTFAFRSLVEIKTSDNLNSVLDNYQYELQAKGKYLSIGFQYAGWSVAVDIQKRKALREALEEIVPLAVEKFVSEVGQTWQTQIISTEYNRFLVEGGFDDELDVGSILVGQGGNTYFVQANVNGQVSRVTPALWNSRKPYVGEVLRWTDGHFDPWQVQSYKLNASGETDAINTVSREISASDSQSRKLLDGLQSCHLGKVGWLESMMMGLMGGYGLYRYYNELDQDYIKHSDSGTLSAKALSSDYYERQTLKTKSVTSVDVKESAYVSQTRNVRKLRVAVLGSGLNLSDPQLAAYIDNSGFDFISWDKRPHDDFGQTTKWAKKAVGQLRDNIHLIPYKVIGAYGDVHSGELFTAFQSLSRRADIDVVVVDFQPVVPSSAFSDGVTLVESAKIPVFQSQNAIVGIKTILEKGGGR